MGNENAAFREEKNALQSYNNDADKYITYKRNELNAHVIPAVESFDTDAVFQELGQAHNTERNLQKSIAEVMITQNSPYFKRYDVRCAGQSKTFYVGEHEVQFGSHSVFQWQQAGTRPMLDFLMRGPATQRYTDAYGSEYERLLERKIDIQNRQLLDVSDEFVSDSVYAQLGINDPFLVNVIKRRRKDGLAAANIISTVQHNQYEIIRYPVDESFVVQGCAGSGKTYIMLNRLSYLLFNSQTFHLSPENVVIVSPNPRIQYQLANVIVDLKVDAVLHTRIEDWYLDLLKRFSLRFDNSVIMAESSLDAKYENDVFSRFFHDKVCSSIQKELEKINEQAEVLTSNSTIVSWARIRSIALGAKRDSRDLISFIRAVDREARRIEKDFTTHCEANAISIDDIEKIILDDSSLDNYRHELDDIDLKISEILRLDSLFEEYQVAKELLFEENDIFERHKEEVKARLQNSLRMIRDIDSMTPEDRTEILTKHLRLEADNLSFEDGGTSSNLHLDHVNECNTMINEAWYEIMPRLPGVYQTSSEEARNAMRDDYDALLKQKAELEEIISRSTFGTNRQRMIRQRAADLRKAMLPDEQMRSVSEFMRSAGNLPARARDIASGMLRELKQKYSIPLLITDSDNTSGTIISVQKRVLYRSDLYIILLAVTRMNGQSPLFPWKLLCFDEAQDVSCLEYDLIMRIFEKTANLNVFGDIRQGRKGCRSSIDKWQVTFPLFPVFQLNENYRNAQQITELMNKQFSTNMLAIGVDGFVQEASSQTRKQVFLKYVNENSDGWIIARDRETFQAFVETLGMKPDSLKLSYAIENSINKKVVLSIDQVKGLEFPRVLVITTCLNENQKYIAMTRALSELYIV